ncbi:hypothetical protein HBI24_025780 [Parastagonospora nodorum]|nr:hypothetical protein HBI10_105750 [Parastagonospora nodorum]KAH4010010.1 hypothetical protein HBI13_212920 [Parastagonospora nodorum]KAH4111933.1 hypothetical protein HBH47_233160 [Parastagonospora nodorum]KAH4904861.1 hypothetical protein HBH74_179550 [Parastagonospora nodorum]KAH4907088.1 hypothetical protein HBI80_073960 [Parastagonospora nodorum]
MECNALLHLAKGALYQRDELLRMYNKSSAGLPSLQQYNAPGSNTINNIVVNQVKASSRPPVVETDDDSDDTDDGIEDSAVIPAPLYRTQCKRKEGACQLHRCKFFHNSQLSEYGDIRDSLPKNPMEVKMLEIQG